MKDRKETLLRRADIPPAYKLVAIALFDAEKDGVIANCRQEDIAEVVGVHRGYVAHILRDLKEMGVIAFDHGRHHPGVYRFVGEYAPEGVVA